MRVVPDLSDRKTYIGGSDAPAIMGVSRFKSALQVYAEKVAGPDAAESENEWMYWGRLLEDDVLQAYADKTGRSATPGNGRPIYHADHRWMAGRIDAKITDERGDGILEIKTTGLQHKHLWEDGPPLEVQVQLQHYLAVTGCSWGSIAVLIGGQTFEHFDIERNDKFIEALIKKEEEFWQRVIEQRPPDPDGTRQSTRAIMALFPKETEGREVVLNGTLTAMTDEIANLSAEIERLSLQKSEKENAIKMAIGDAEIGVLQDGRRWTYKTISRSGYSVEPTSYRRLMPPRIG